MMLDAIGNEQAATYLKEDLLDIAETFHALGMGGCSVYVSGATGLVGSMIVRGALCHNQHYPDNPISVLAGCRSAEKARMIFGDNDDLEVVEGDLREGLCLCRECDYLIHLASPTSSRYFLSSPVEVISSIVDGTRNVLEAAKDCNPQGFIYVSSMEAFGQVRSAGLSTEDDLGYIDLHSPRSCYPEAKRMAELLSLCYYEEYGVPTRIVRLAQTFGAGVGVGEGRVFAQFARSALVGEDIVLHTLGRSIGNYCYLSDAVRGILYVLTKGEPGETYSVANEEMTMSILEMARLVSDVVSSGKSRIKFDIPEHDELGYAADTELRMDASRLGGLGWIPKYGMADAYMRMSPGLKGAYDAQA